MVAVGALASGFWLIGVYDSAPSIASLRPISKGAVSKVYGADGSLIGVIHSDNIRQPVSSAQIPQDLKDATVAIEDRRFYSHGGIDPSAIIRAGWEDLTAGGKPVEGGSTITQQLVRNLYIEDPQDTLHRKIIEAHLANDEEDQHSKDWILTEYLNTASYGTNNGATAIGVEAAAETYYSKHARDLTLPEAAMIAGLPQAPSQYNPLLNPRAALARRNEVLQAMEQQGKISSSEYQEVIGQDLGLDPGNKYTRIRDPYIFDLVKQELQDRYGLNTVQSGGLKVYTTIKPRLQQAAQSAVDSCSVCYSGGGPASALASVNPSNGKIVALASTQRYSEDSQFNFAAHAQRQPGSSFKVYDLTAAIKQGIDPDTTYYDGSSPKTLETPGGSSWTVNNAEQGGGVLPLTEATWESVNVVFAQLGLDVGPENIARTAYDMGITSPLGVKGSRDIGKLGPNCFIPPADAISGLSVGVTRSSRQLPTHPRQRRRASRCDRHRPRGLPRRERRRAELEGGQACADRRPGLRGHEGSRGRHHQRHRRRLHEHRLPVGGRKDRHQRGPLRRLVRRLHADVLDRGVDGAPALACLHRIRRPHLRPDLALLHGSRPGRRVPRLRGSDEPAELVRIPRGAHGVQLELLQQLLFL
jgi:penicillin-binding protein 1A